MPSHEQTQADLLEQFRQTRDNDPPGELDAELAAVAVMLEDRLSPPAPSARFVQSLGRRLDAESNHSGNQRQTGVLPPLSDQTIPPSSPPDDRRREGADEPRRPWYSEAARIASAALAIAVVGAILVLLFRDADEAVAPGAGETLIHTGEILISWDPNGGEDYKLFIVDTDSGEVRKLNYGSAESGGVFSDGPAEADGVVERFAAWSPDGRKIAFVRAEAGQSDIIVMNANGSDPVNVTNSPGSESTPNWSPDGTQIAYVSSHEGQFVANIHVVNSDGSNPMQLTHSPTGALSLDWSPDGSQIVYAVRSMESHRVWVMNADGSDAHAITERHNGFIGKTAWAPDGRHVAFGVDGHVWIVAPDGTGLRNVTKETGATSHPDWSSDGQRLLYLTGNFEDRTNRITVANSDGMVLDRWASNSTIQDSPSWSPDERQIGFFARVDQNEGTESEFRDLVTELRIAGVDGSSEHSLLASVGLDYTWPPAWRPPVTGDPPPVGPTPTLIAPPKTEAGTDRLYVVTSNGVTVTDPATGDEIYSIDGDSPDAALSPDGSRLYVAGTDGVVDLVAFDAASGDEIWRTPVEDRIRWIEGQGPSTLAVSQDGSRIYLYSSNAPDTQWIQVINANTGEWIAETETMASGCPAMLQPLRDGDSLFLVCQRTRWVTRIDLNELRPTNTANLGGPITGSVMSPDGTLLYVVSLDQTGLERGGFEVTVFSDAETLATPQPLAADEKPPVLGQMVTLSPDGSRLYVAIGTEDNDGDSGTQDVREIAVFDTSSWEEVDRITLDVPLKGGAFTMSPDGQYIYASERLQSESEGKLIRIDVESGETSTVLVRNAEMLRVLTATARPVESVPPATPTVEPIEGAPPSATLSFRDANQVGEFAYGCGWPPEETICVDPAGLLFPEQAIQVPAGTELSFTVEGMADLVNVQANAYLLNDDATIEGLQGKPFLTYPPPPAAGLPVSPSSTQPRFVVDLPPGDYAIQMDVGNSSNESGTYGFHIAVAGESVVAPSESEVVPSGLVEFDRFPVWSLGDTFGEFVLDNVSETFHDSNGTGDVSFEFTYVAEDRRTDVGIQVTSQGLLSDTELQAREESRQGLGETIVVNGIDGWLTPVDDNVTMIELDPDGGHLTIVAANRETALAAAEAVQQMNGPSGVELDPFAPAFPDAEVVHVVSVVDFDQIDESYTTETWIDQITGDVIVQRFDSNGTLASATMRHGLKVITYSPPALMTSELLSSDAPIFEHVDGQLYGYRKQLQEGTAEIEGADEIDGRLAVRINVELYPGHEAVVYLDAETLFPLRFDGGPGEDWTMTYPTIETLEQEAMPVELFELDFPDVTHISSSKELTQQEAAGFKDYGIWSAGPIFGDYSLAGIQHVTTSNPDTPGTDRVTVRYKNGNADENIQVDLYGSQFSREWEAWQSKHGPSSESITIQGQQGWLRANEAGGPVELIFQWYAGYLTINAPDRETAIGLAERLQQVNGA